MNETQISKEQKKEIEIKRETLSKMPVREMQISELDYQDNTTSLAWLALNTKTIADNHRSMIFDIVLQFAMQHDFVVRLEYWRDSTQKGSRHYKRIDDLLMEFSSYRISQTLKRATA